MKYLKLILSIFLILLCVGGLLAELETRDPFGVVLALIFGGLGILLFRSYRKSKQLSITKPKQSIDNIDKPYYQPTNRSGITSYRSIYNCTELPDKFVILDLETTGLESSKDRIIEVAIMTCENGEIVDTYSQLIDPKIKIPKAASNINGITNEMIKGQPKINEVIEQIYNRINSQIIVGYNVEFDIRFLSAALARCNLHIDEVTALDVLQLVKETIPSRETKDRKLSTIKEYYRIDGNSHRALDDCRVTFEILKRCIKTKENIELQRKSEQMERLSKLNDDEKNFIDALTEKLDTINLKDRLDYNVLGDKTINFQIDNMQIGRVKLRGKTRKMQILDKANVIWLDIENLDEAINNIKHWIKYCEYLTK